MLHRFFTRRSRRGANAVEFGLTAPVFFAMVLGLMDYGWYFANQAGLNNANSLGCREGSTATARTEIGWRSSMFCGGGCSTTVLDLYAGETPPRRTLLCTTTTDYDPLIGFVPTPRTVTTSAYYRVEWQRRW